MQPAPQPQAPEKTPVPAGPIVVELGGAPEVGDPHFRIFIDDEQVLDGNIDWGLGLPAAGDDADGICWQSREVPWDFADGPPGEIVLRYDGGGPGESGAGTLMARAVDVGGVRIEADGPHAHRPDGEHAWAGRGDGASWVGRLVFDVTAALGGPKDKGPEPKAEAEPLDAPAAEAPPAEQHYMRAGETLVLRPNAEDLANPAVMASFATLRAKLRGAGDAGTAGQLPEMLGRLNFDAAKWSDLLVIAPDGRPIAIGEAPPPQLPETTPKFSPDEVQAALARLEATPEPEPEPSEHEPELEPMPAIAAVSTEDRHAPGSELRDVFFAERLVRAQTQKRMALERAVEQVEEAGAEPATDRDWLPVPAAEGVRLRESFLTAWAIRADTLADDRVLTPQAATERSRPAEPVPRPELRGEGISQAFLTMQLRHALERLHAPASDKKRQGRKLVPGGTAAEVSRGGGPLGGAFLDELVERARARMAPEAGAAI